jgi:site-specific DNA recombinase
VKRTNGPVRDGLTHALLYRRVSGAEHQKDGLSMPAQEAALRAYAASQPGWLIGGEYHDIMSGKRADRPGYVALLEHARQLHQQRKQVAIVLIRLDRLGRRPAEYFRAAEELAKQGALVHSIKDGGVLDETHANILAVFARDEARRIGMRVGETRSFVVNSGWHWGKTPFGYRKRAATPDERARGGRPAVLEPDPSTCGIAVEVFERYARGDSIYAVSQWLAGLPEALRGGRAWPAQCVWSMLQSPSYVARPAEGDDEVLSRPVARWEPLISDDLYLLVQGRLASQRTRPHQATDRYLLTGFMRCPNCGHRMVHTSTRRGDRGGEVRGRYRCAGHFKGASAPDPTCRYEIPDTVDRLVIDRLADVLETLAEPSHWPAIRKAWHARQTPTTDSRRQIAELEREVKVSQQRLARAARMLVDGDLDRSGYEALRNVETATVATAETKLRRLAEISASPAPNVPGIDQVFEQAGSWARIWREVDVRHQRAILDQLVDHITVQRRGYRQYSGEITWSDIGQRLIESMSLGLQQ